MTSKMREIKGTGTDWYQSAPALLHGHPLNACPQEDGLGLLTEEERWDFWHIALFGDETCGLFGGDFESHLGFAGGWLYEGCSQAWLCARGVRLGERAGWLWSGGRGCGRWRWRVAFHRIAHRGTACRGSACRGSDCYGITCHGACGAMFPLPF